ncbi:MAG TPA: flippase, partial [Proteobacteria bacterium]|nr:flippase [Pseudomonadota bacterium]
MITDADSKTKIRMAREDGSQTPGPEILTIAKGAGIGFMGMVIGSALRYLFQIIIARNLGPELFGLFILGLTVFKVTGMIAEMGLPRGIVRYVALFRGEGDESRLKGVIILSIRIALTSSIVFALLLFAFSRTIAVSIFHKSELTIVLRIFALVLPFTTLTTMLLFATQGFKIMKYKAIVSEIFEPLGRLILVIILFLLGLKLYGVIFAYLIPLVAGTWLAFHYLKKVFPPVVKKELRPTYETKQLLHFSWPLLFVNFFGFMIMWIDTLMLGYFKTSQDVGIYSAAQRTALLGCLIVASFNSIFAPVISDLHNRKEFSSLNEYFKTVAKWMFTFSFPISLLIIFFARGILNLFGPQFVSGIPSLIILSVGWIIYSG